MSVLENGEAGTRSQRDGFDLDTFAWFVLKGQEQWHATTSAGVLRNPAELWAQAIQAPQYNRGLPSEVPEPDVEGEAALRELVAAATELGDAGQADSVETQQERAAVVEALSEMQIDVILRRRD